MTTNQLDDFDDLPPAPILRNGAVRTHAQVAEILGISVDNVRHIYAGAMRKLRARKEELRERLYG